MDYRLITILLLLGVCSTLFAAKSSPFNYDKVWEEIEQLRDKRLPKSASEKIDVLLRAAEKEKKIDQQVKALVYQLIMQQYVEEFSSQKAVEQVKMRLEKASFPATAIMHSMLAQLYWNYYQQNRWRFGQRTETIELKRDDIATWDLKTITKETMQHFALSLSQPGELQKLKIDDYPAMLEKANKEGRGFRPTLYDLLVHSALDFYTNDESGLSKPSDEFSITDTKYFRSANQFSSLEIVSPDTLSFKYLALKLYQDLINFHIKDKDPAVLVDVNLARLRFVYKNSSLSDSEVYYEETLRMEESLHKNHEASTEIIFERAKLMHELGNKYNPKLSDKYKDYYITAVELCNKALESFPKSFGAISCSALKYQILNPSIQLYTENIVIPNQSIKLLLTARNLEQVSVSVYRISFPSGPNINFEDYGHYWRDEKNINNMLKTKPVNQIIINIPHNKDYREVSLETSIKGLAPGRYLLIAKNTADTPSSHSFLGYCEFVSSNLAYLQQKQSSQMTVLNRLTGNPISNVIVRAYTRDWDNKSRKQFYKLYWSDKTDNDGNVILPKPLDYWNNTLILNTQTDTLVIGNVYGHDSGPARRIEEKCLLFLDRAIYRPGQTIYVKGVAYQTDYEKHHKLLTGKSVTVTLYDVNRQVVSKINLLTNEFGTFNTTFTAPQGVLTGQMSINTSPSGSVSFSVEEYKRPKFEVKFDTPKETYKLNSVVSVKGKALSYAGFPIDNAEVSFRVVRQPRFSFWYWWWGPGPSTPQKEIMQGSAKTDANGEFIVTFIAQGDDTLPKYGYPYFVFTVSADVVDISGETRSGSLSVSIGEKELLLDVTVGDKINLRTEKLTLPVKTTNLSGEPIPVKGTIKISTLQAPERIQKARVWNIKPTVNPLSREQFYKIFPNDIWGEDDNISNWKVLNSVFTGEFNTPDEANILVFGFKKWKPGAYVLEATASYNQQEVKITKYFTVYDSRSKSLPYPMANWFVPVKTTCEPGESASILIGSSYSDVRVYYELEKQHKSIESRIINLDKEQRLITIPVTEDDRGGFYVHFAYVRDGRLYTHTQMISVPWTNKRIDFEYMTFRDKLLPGQQEDWRLMLKDYTGGKVSAELLASMYDASLDAFRPSSWNASIYGNIHSSRGWYNYSFVSLTQLNLIRYPIIGHGYPTRNYTSFNWYGYNLYGFARPFDYISYDMAGSERAQPMLSAKASVSEESISDMMANGIFGAQAITGEARAEQKQDLTDVQARTNFAETTFFYPELRTDENGEISFVFTVPEALTRWKFRALALTQDLLIGTTENTTVTQKPLMVTPNAPRFLREGDKIYFSAKITSLDETDQSGSCQLFLYDSITMTPIEKIFNLDNPHKPFSVKKGESTVLSWELTIPFGVSAVTYRVVARAGDFSDGEESTLPILTNRMLVTESLPLPVRGNTIKNFVLEKLKDSQMSKTLKHHRLTLEFTSNPAWYAVQALPYMMEYPYECNEQIFTRFYGNSLASHIANANPRIKRVFDAWKDTPNSTALLSNLEKNQELKSLILQETPWVLDAKNEAQSKQRIALLFDLNNMANQFNSALTKLQKNQLPNGAWSWFPGMPDSWWITQYIVEGFGHLDHLKVNAVRDNPKIWNMVQKAIVYLDEQILENYENIKKYGNLNEDNLGYLQMHYLYARSFFKDIKIADDSKVAYDYFMGQCDKYWMNKGLYGQGLIALAQHRYDKRVLPAAIVASLRERALHNEELGMWWKSDDWGWFWYQAPIETHTLLMEVFHDVAKDTDAVDELRTWLLKNKQTTNWKTTKATAQACYALLLTGTEWLNTEALAEITLAGKVIDPMQMDDVKVEAGTGYFKTSWSGSDITPQMANVTVKNPNRVSAWGSLYWQYFEDLDKITPAETPLKLNKKLFIERMTPGGKVIEPISDKAQLKVGDKVIVRIELRCDRDMEYVHMKDMRSAGFEPINVLSRYKWQDGLGYYEATGDAATNFFIEYLRKGTYVFEYPLRVFNQGDFSNGITTIQCMYAPEFTSHSEGIRVIVK